MKMIVVFMEDFKVNLYLTFQNVLLNVAFHVEIAASAHFPRSILPFLDNHDHKFSVTYKPKAI